MKKMLLALDIQSHFNTSEMIVSAVNKLAVKLPTMATVLVQGDRHGTTTEEWLNWKAPVSDTTKINTKYAYERSGYALPPVILQAITKNNIDEVYVVGGRTEAFLLAAGAQLFDLGVKVTLIAPLALSGQYYQHTVTMKIWEASIGHVYENVGEVQV